MEDETTIRKVSVWADSWWKILSIIAAVVFGIYQISAVWLTIQSTQSQIQQFQDVVGKDNAFRDDRAEKRYNRAIDMYNELKERGINLENDYKKHLVEDAYHRGKMDAQIEFLLNKK